MLSTPYGERTSCAYLFVVMFLDCTRCVNKPKANLMDYRVILCYDCTLCVMLSDAIPVISGFARSITSYVNQFSERVLILNTNNFVATASP